MMDTVSNLDEPLPKKPRKIKRRSKKTRGGLLFPYKLQKTLLTTAVEGKQDIISWLEPDGKLFRVHKVPEFVREVLPLYFKQTKIKSFQRQLNLWGFLRIVDGPSKGAYYHNQFVRDRPDMVHLLTRQKGPARNRPTSNDAAVAASLSMKPVMSVPCSPSVLQDPSIPPRPSSPIAVHQQQCTPYKSVSDSTTSVATPSSCSSSALNDISVLPPSPLSLFATPQQLLAPSVADSNTIKTIIKRRPAGGATATKATMHHCHYPLPLPPVRQHVFDEFASRCLSSSASFVDNKELEQKDVNEQGTITTTSIGSFDDYLNKFDVNRFDPIDLDEYEKFANYEYEIDASCFA